MGSPEESISRRSRAWGLWGAVLAAVTASVCCVGPLLLLGLGVSGAWIGTLTALEPVRPVVSIAALGFLGFAFYRAYRTPSTAECAEGRPCDRPGSRRFTKTAFWVAAVAVLALLAFPYVAPHLFANAAPAEGTSQASRVVLVVENMHCATCPVTVAASLEQVAGVVDAQVTLDPPEAVVFYDEKQTNMDELIDATIRAGYPSSTRPGNKK